MHVVATAGHVDHGKSTLVRALTGIDPDRLAEEKARGLTIDLGFAWATLPSGREVGFVDVPGHVRFLKNMLAGVGAVDAVLFVVDAVEGWKPQSEEHLRILEVLGARHGLVALTKVAGLDRDSIDLAVLDVEERVAGTFLEAAAVVAVDAPSGKGVDRLSSNLDVLLSRIPTALDLGRPRLWIDRAFAAKGSGTVVTGTLTGGAISVDESLAVIVRGASRPVRVRGLQTHETPLRDAPPGRRLAVNMTGVSHSSLGRGDALVRADQWHLTARVDATLSVLPSLPHDVSRRGSYQAYVGTGEHAVAVRVLGDDAIAPGSTGFVRLHLPVRLPVVPGDRFVLRESGRAETVGGGEILDVDPVRPASKARPDRSPERVVAERRWVEVDQLAKLTGRRELPAGVRAVGRWATTEAVLQESVEALRDAVDRSGAAGVDTSALSEQERAVLGLLSGVAVEEGRARAAGHRTDGAALSRHPFVLALDASPFSPPAPRDLGVDGATRRMLVQRGLVVERDGLHFSRTAVEAAAVVVARLLKISPEGVTVSEVREALGTSRKYLLPLLGILDSSGVTRRRGDVRVAGPRLPEV